MLHSKMQEYNVDARIMYNIDKKAFFVSNAERLKRVFTKAV